MKIRPLHDRLIVRRQEEERTTASGIVIPESASAEKPDQGVVEAVGIVIPESASAEKPDQGVVEAVGNGKLLEDGNVRKLDVKVGDKVLFGKYAGQAVKVDGDELLVMKEEDVMGIIE